MVWMAPSVMAAGEVPIGVAAVAGIVAAFAMLTVGIYGVLRWKTYWSGHGLVPRRSVYGTRAARAMGSTYPFVFVLMIGFGLALTVLSLGDLNADAFGRLASALQPVFFVLLAILVLLLVTMILFNRPQFLVPPHARDSGGFIGDVMRNAIERRKK